MRIAAVFAIGIAASLAGLQAQTKPRATAGPGAVAPGVQASGRFDVREAAIADMQKAMADKRVSSREIVTQYLTRIAMYEKVINAAIAINPHALEDADALAAERRGPCVCWLHATLRSDAGQEPARRRRDHHREDGPDGARKLGRRRAIAHARQLQ